MGSTPTSAAAYTGAEAVDRPGGARRSNSSAVGRDRGGERRAAARGPPDVEEQAMTLGGERPAPDDSVIRAQIAVITGERNREEAIKTLL